VTLFFVLHSGEAFFSIIQDFSLKVDGFGL